MNFDDAVEKINGKVIIMCKSARRGLASHREYHKCNCKIGHWTKKCASYTMALLYNSKYQITTTAPINK